MNTSKGSSATETGASWKSILDLTAGEAKAFLLKPESYCNVDLPAYIGFGTLINKVHIALDGRNLSSLSSKPRNYDDVNYTILNNKDGKYAWRPFQLIHPALYVSLIHCLTEDASWQVILGSFKSFAANDRIQCLSLPVMSLSEEKDKAEQISHWWHAVEQRSIELSLDYEYLLETDITDCYGAIYTHSIAWALHTKPNAKKGRNEKSLLGNIIDAHIQDMRHGQTNGIPQGSVLMDFIAEMVLGLADKELSDKINATNVKDYRILRYRDDYRVFVNNPQDGELILKLLSEVMIGLGLKLNPAKTKASSDVIRSSIKPDKLAWLARKHGEKSLQKMLFIIHDHANQFPNAGSLVVALGDFHKNISRRTSLVESPMPLIAIVMDIAYRNPRCYAMCAAILSKLMSFLDSPEEKIKVAERIKSRFKKIPNTGHMEIWIQRVTLPIDREIRFEESVCRLISGEKVSLWNIEWISCKALKRAIATSSVIDTEKVDALESVITPNEIELFISRAMRGYYG